MMTEMPPSGSEKHAPGSTPGSPPGAPQPAGAPDQARLAALRTRINDLDANLIRLLNERARVVVEVGALKRAGGIPIYAPHRESDVLKRVLAANEGPLPDRALEAIYRELMSGSFALEQPLRIGYLGPPGSFSHVAATAHFGSSVEFDDVHDIAAVFAEVARGHIDYGLVPIENSTGGGIVETLDAFKDHRESGVTIYAEVLVTIRHHLFAGCAPDEVKRIYSKHEIFSQCRKWLASQFPSVELVPAPSSSRAVAMARQDHDRDPKSGSAAIGSLLAGQLNGLEPLFEDVEDNPNNITRFFVLAKQAAQPSGDDKTSIMFTTADKPGALVGVLSVFDRAGVNLTHIDKRPSGRENWHYTFFIDAQGHRGDAAVQFAIRESAAHCREVTVLGSYPRAKRIL